MSTSVEDNVDPSSPLPLLTPVTAAALAAPATSASTDSPVWPLHRPDADPSDTESSASYSQSPTGTYSDSSASPLSPNGTSYSGQNAEGSSVSDSLSLRYTSSTDVEDLSVRSATSSNSFNLHRDTDSVDSATASGLDVRRKQNRDSKGLSKAEAGDRSAVKTAAISNSREADHQLTIGRPRIDRVMPTSSQRDTKHTSQARRQGHHSSSEKLSRREARGVDDPVSVSSQKENRRPSRGDQRKGDETELMTKRHHGTSRMERAQASRADAPRTFQQQAIRIAALYLVPAVLSACISLQLALNTILLTPLYNSIPLTLHTTALYAVYLVPPTVIYWYLTTKTSAREQISARVCLSIAALSGDMVAVGGRRVASQLGQILGPEWGAWASRAILGVGAVGGSAVFALLCFDHISAIPPAASSAHRPRIMGSVLYRAMFFLLHVWLSGRLWSRLLGTANSYSLLLTRSPERTILAVSLLLTLLSLLLRPDPLSSPFSAKVHSGLSRSLQLSPRASAKLLKVTSKILPDQAFPVLLLLRIPLIILALRQQIFLRPPANQPYLTAGGQLRILSSQKSLTGQVVVAENLKDGYRYLRCDQSILGGRWIRDVPDESAENGQRTEMGDSIFATFNLQEIGLLAHRNDPRESVLHALTVDTDPDSALGEDKQVETEVDRALIIGLGAGIAASTFSKRGMNVDIVEIDPAVYFAAHDHFGLATLDLASSNIVDGAAFVTQLAEMKRDDETDPESIPVWDYVVQDCFTGGSVPGEMFTVEFWEDLGEVLKPDAIVALNFAGIRQGRASKAVLVTLLSVFPQCRAFGDGFEKDQGAEDLINMVVFCTKTHSPLLTFRAPTRQDALRSPLRAHVYSTFHANEIQLDSIVSEQDHSDPELLLRRGKSELNQWQVDSSLATWRAMQKILTPEMWLAY